MLDTDSTLNILQFYFSDHIASLSETLMFGMTDMLIHPTKLSRPLIKQTIP